MIIIIPAKMMDPHLVSEDGDIAPAQTFKSNCSIHFSNMQGCPLPWLRSPQKWQFWPTLQDNYYQHLPYPKPELPLTSLETNQLYFQTSEIHKTQIKNTTLYPIVHRRYKM